MNQHPHLSMKRFYIYAIRYLKKEKSEWAIAKKQRSGTRNSVGKFPHAQYIVTGIVIVALHCHTWHNDMSADWVTKEVFSLYNI